MVLRRLHPAARPDAPLADAAQLQPAHLPALPAAGVILGRKSHEGV
jgi:hypothetical protein